MRNKRSRRHIHPSNPVSEALLSPSYIIQLLVDNQVQHVLTLNDKCVLRLVNKETRDCVDQNSLLKYWLALRDYRSSHGRSQGFLENVVKFTIWLGRARTDLTNSNTLRLLHSSLFPRLRVLFVNTCEVDHRPFLVNNTPWTTLEVVHLTVYLYHKNSALKDEFFLPRYWDSVK